jgi:hypothetical protein
MGGWWTNYRQMSKFSYQSFLESVQDLRKYLKTEPRFSEKGKDLDSGGSLDSALANIMISILSLIEREVPGVKVAITTGNDTFHQKMKTPSKHKAGKAIDFTITPYNASNGEKIKKILDRFAEGNKGFSYLDEYTKPSKYSTGGHFHISYDPKNPEGSHARKPAYGETPIDLGISSDTYKKYGGEDAPIDTWAGFIQRIERNS